MERKRFWLFLLAAILLAANCTPARAEGPRIRGDSGDLEPSLGVLKQALGSKDYATRLFAVQALGDVRAYDVDGWLEHALGDPEHDVRVAALDSLRRSGSARAMRLLRSVRDDRTETLDVRALAAGALLSRKGE